MKLPNWLRPDKWETVYVDGNYTVTCGRTFGSSFETNGTARIQVERRKNKCRAIMSAAGQTQTVDIFEVCKNNPQAQAVCKEEGINWRI